ncbi:hypothetical protein [Flavihumibacter petaseus]|nr:hypothetical protein [Flavihumibacter petaseus]
MLKAFSAITLSLVLSVSMIACKKGDDGPKNEPHMTAKFNGESKSFSQAHAMKTQLGEGYNLSIVGVNGTKETFTINLWSDMNDFHSGESFTSEAAVNGSANSLGWAADLMNSNETTIWSNASFYVENPEEMHVTITEINSETVKGTFSGTIYQNVANPGSRTITEGEFVAKFSLQ